MATGKALDGKPYAGNPHVRFDEGEVAPAATLRRGSLLYKTMKLWNCGNARASRLASHALTALGVCIFAYFHTSTFAYCAANAAALADAPVFVRVAAANSSEAARSAADFVCTGTNDEAMLTKAIDGLVRGGTMKLADGDYWIDAFPYEGNSAVYFGYNDGLTRVVTVEGTTEGKVYGSYRGATLHVTKRAMDAMEPNGVYRVFFGAGRIPEGPGDTYTYTHVNNVNFSNFRLLFNDASKPLVGIDGRHFGSMELDMIGIYTERYFPDRYEHLKPVTPAKGSIGVWSLPGSNDESARNRYNEVNVGGLHTGFVFNAVDHLVMTGCMAARCVYGYWFERGSPKTLTMINCCDEGCVHLPHFRGRGHLTAIDFNIERFNTAYIPNDPENGKEHAATEAKGGSWHGYISYTLQGKAFGLKRFWAEGSGLNFRTENLDHSRFSRPANPEYLETYFDKKTKKTLTWDGSAWVDAMGNPATVE